MYGMYGFGMEFCVRNCTDKKKSCTEFVRIFFGKCVATLYLHRQIIDLHVFISIYLSIYIHLYIFLSIYLSIYLFIYLSIYWSILDQQVPREVQDMVDRQLERQQINKERRMAENEQFQKVRNTKMVLRCTFYSVHT